MLDNIKFIIRHRYQQLSGSTIEFDLNLFQSHLVSIKKQVSELESESDGQLKQISEQLQNRIQQGESPDAMIIDAYALVHEVIRRVLKLRAFDVQIIGGMALHAGKLIEMQTGEGKTLTAVFPAFLNALSGQGVHILTFNDYLAKRDAGWMGPVYRFLGLTVGYVQEGMSTKARQKAYASDITYLTAKESGFDFLRDSLCYNRKNLVHRAFNYAIIDEADSILIDEARIPLVIAGAADDQIPDICRTAEIANDLKLNSDFEFDEYARDIHLTESGTKRAEARLECKNLYAEENVDLLTRLNCALHAQYLLHCDVDYIVRDGSIELVDEFTGRVADKRRWPDGLQAALEAKEDLVIQKQGKILNSISLQNFLPLYDKIAGMTATAQTAAEELHDFYDIDIVVIPPNKPCIRQDHKDIIFVSKNQKLEALITEIVSIHKTRRPILVGTVSVEESVHIAEALQKHAVECNILNARRDAFEAEIIAEAGKLDAVTISTNMAGRGTDIRLGGQDEVEKEKVVALGGLYVIGTNKHESARIDKQLRGRAGRQGDPGSSRFFISLEDDLFIKYRLNELLPAGLQRQDKAGEIDNNIIRKEIDRIQRIIEGQNFEIKQTLCKYSVIIEKQRQLIFRKRAVALREDEAARFFKSEACEQYDKLRALVGEEQLFDFSSKLLIYCIDACWADYLAGIAEIRESIHLRSLGGQVPHIEFQKMAVGMFDELNVRLDEQALELFNQVQVAGKRLHLDNGGLKIPTATWTYLISDKAFESLIGLIGPGNVGMAAGAGLYGMLMALYPLLRRIGRKK